jgi:hypothetical protein
MRTVRSIAVIATLVAGTLIAPTAPIASATVYCTFGLVWQNAYVPGEDSGTWSPGCVMASGAGPNNAVRTLQSNLNKCHGKSLAVDGEFGPATRSALIAVQRALQITADGVYGPQTARAMSHGRSDGGSGCKRVTF